METVKKDNSTKVESVKMELKNKTVVGSAKNSVKTQENKPAVKEEAPKKAEKKAKAETPVQNVDKQDSKFICEDCGAEIKGAKKFTAEQIVQAGKEKYGRCLCVDCAKKAKAELEAQIAETEPQEDLAAQLMADAE